MTKTMTDTDKILNSYKYLNILRKKLLIIEEEKFHIETQIKLMEEKLKTYNSVFGGANVN